eukprot:GHUV01024243.1.p1 GENE.GHUV01024243.1~~GHUV01024243.1.p1  ORF type:complete len:126 (+),score=20.42 GHUV01024243.1:41-379(+)
MAFAMQNKSSVVSRTARVQAPRIAPVAAPLRARSVVTYASVDKAQVLADVRAIISEQLGTEVDKVAPEAKFVDLGADSLDTVEIMMALGRSSRSPWMRRVLRRLALCRRPLT